ncbi:hypothetical protein [Paraburkholderia tropica]|uniref:hypothetical protein n=1 Tax=Paraburkholderia tropica TaxID=92647 RepID=UPI002AB069F7|nr:hypothetical protein [Paraburkholderia tropica]
MPVLPRRDRYFSVMEPQNRASCGGAHLANDVPDMAITVAVLHSRHRFRASEGPPEINRKNKGFRFGAHEKHTEIAPETRRISRARHAG